MSKLHDKLRVIATSRLDNMMERAREEICEIIAETRIPMETMALLARGRRTETLRKNAIKTLVDVAIDELLEEFNSQQDLPLADKKESL